MTVDNITRPAVPDITPPVAPSTPRFTNSASALPGPGECSMTLPLVQYSNGAIAPMNTGCTFPDSALVRITVSGKITATASPLSTCCFPNATYVAAGSYGPMGGGSSYNWQALFVRIPITFGSGAPTVESGFANPWWFGDTTTTIRMFEGSYVGRQGSTVKVERYAIQGGSSCQTNGAATFLTEPRVTRLFVRSPVVCFQPRELIDVAVFS